MGLYPGGGGGGLIFEILNVKLLLLSNESCVNCCNDILSQICKYIIHPSIHLYPFIPVAILESRASEHDDA